ncbi:MAG: glycosyltransferase [Pseudomonadales bacterium]|nr:glycosyltransferase [Pseudomonadales bacterium]
MFLLLFGLSALALFYIYVGYELLLKLLCLFFVEKCKADSNHQPSVTVLVTVHNEEALISSRIENILANGYLGDLSVVVCSDRSSDDTNRIAAEYEDSRVILLESNGSNGKSAAQNFALDHITSEIVVFTDAETRFASGFVTNLVAEFADPSVGAVDGMLLFNGGNNGVVSGQSKYWQAECRVRSYESSLGILAVCSGACVAARRSLIDRLPEFVGEDCVIPLQVVEKGFSVRHTHRAIAWDVYDSRAELANRVRMTQRNWQGTLLYPHLLNPLKYPGIAFALWSHKLLRWLSPIFLILFSISLFVLGLLWDMVQLSLVVVFFYLVSIFGWLSKEKSLDYTLAEIAYSFLLANVGFLLGVIRGAFGRRVTSYKSS